MGFDKSESGYMGTKEAAERWGVSQDTVRRWCRERKFADEIKLDRDAPGSPWRIPTNAKPPITNRNNK